MQNRSRIQTNNIGKHFQLTSCNLFLIILITTSCLFQKSLTNLTSINDGYYLPQMVFEHNILFGQNVNITKFQANGQILSFLAEGPSYNMITNYDADNFNYNSSNILSNFYQFPNFSNNSIIQDFQIDSSSQILYILLNSQKNQKNISGQSQIIQIDAKTSQILSNFLFNSQNYGNNGNNNYDNANGNNYGNNNGYNSGKVFKQLKFTQNTIYISTYQEDTNSLTFFNDSNNSSNLTTTAQVYRFDRKNINNFTLLEIIQTQLAGIVHIQICGKNQETLVIWNQTTFIEAYNCSVSCKRIFYLESNLTSNVTNKILFNGCNGIIVEYDDVMPITGYSFLGYGTWTRPSDKKILTMDFLDQQGKYLVVFYENNSIVINQIYGYQQTTTPYVGKFDNFTSLNSLSTIQTFSSKLYIPLADKIEVYSMQCPNQTFMYLSGLCVACDSKCKVCNTTNGNCLTCYDSYSLNGTQCILFQTQQYYSDESTISNIVLNSLDGITPVVQKVLFILQVTPISWFFLSFINYWTLCSLYLLTNITIPAYFVDCLTKIYNAVNASIFQQLGINISFNFLNTIQKINDHKLLDYGISSNVISSNGQNFILIGFIFILILIFSLFKQINFFNWIYKWLSLDRFLVMTGQYVPLICSLLLPISYIFKNMGNFNFSDKINTTLSLLFIILSILVPFILFVHFQILKNKKLKKQKIKAQSLLNKKDQEINKDLKQKQNEIKFLEYDWLYNTIVNISISILISFQITVLFLILNFVIFGFGIYIKTVKKKSSQQLWKFGKCKCTMEKIKKYNIFIQPFHIFLFHLGFIGMYIFENRSSFMYHHMSSFSLFFLFLGALHELITIFMQTLFEIYTFIRKQCKTKIQPEKIVNLKKFQANFQLNQQNLQQKNNDLNGDFSHINSIAIFSKKLLIKKKQSHQRQKQQSFNKPDLKNQKLIKKIKIKNCPSNQSNQLYLNINMKVNRNSIQKQLQLKRQQLQEGQKQQSLKQKPNHLNEGQFSQISKEENQLYNLNKKVQNIAEQEVQQQQIFN